MVKGAVLALVFLVAACLTSYLGEERLPAKMPELTPGEFVTVVLLAPARPVAVAILWVRSLSLRTQRDYAHLLPLYETIFKLEPTFAPALEYALYDMMVDLPQREEKMEAKLRWIRKGFLLGLEGVLRTPHTSRVAGTFSWALFFIKTRFPSLAARLEEEKELIRLFLDWLDHHHPEVAARLENDLRSTKTPLNLIHISMCFAEIAVQRPAFNYIPVYVVSFCCRELLLNSTDLNDKIYWAKRALNHWRSFLEHSDLSEAARLQVDGWGRVLSDLEARR